MDEFDDYLHRDEPDDHICLGCGYYDCECDDVYDCMGCGMCSDCIAKSMDAADEFHDRDLGGEGG